MNAIILLLFKIVIKYLKRNWLKINDILLTCGLLLLFGTIILKINEIFGYPVT